MELTAGGWTALLGHEPRTSHRSHRSHWSWSQELEGPLEQELDELLEQELDELLEQELDGLLEQELGLNAASVCSLVCLPYEMVNMTISHLQTVLVLELIRRKAAHIEYLL
ncbi:hypothetical protein FJT64_026224 [Amphibalanus amphitrite]|uniref:Uncharacterized protein n=1 Tax=Amphibalanus amphitrite TaxID=1232801 RepID=A0A6A4WCK8_AMPAM|nr:hypothetical protein FJT64_026224 [Amphibalanus amphitrite]